VRSRGGELQSWRFQQLLGDTATGIDSVTWSRQQGPRAPPAPHTARLTLLRYISTASSAAIGPVFLTVTLTQNAAEL
jgi:hypothetical protein